MVLDDEVDAKPHSDDSLMPHVISFLSAFPDYLDIVVQCTRKTEVRSWRTLFAYLPPPQELFEESLEKGLLKTAGGYLLVLHEFQDLETSSEQCIRLLEKAKEAEDWELCKELARFLMALDGSGDTLREALTRINIKGSSEGNTSTTQVGVQLKTPRFVNDRRERSANGSVPMSSMPVGITTQSTDDETTLSPNGTTVSEDYFSSRS